MHEPSTIAVYQDALHDEKPMCRAITKMAAEWAYCTLRKEAKSVLCEIKICTLLKSVHEEASANPLFSHNHHRDTRFLSVLPRRPRLKAYLTWHLENTDLENSDQRPEKCKPSECFKDSDPKKKTILVVVVKTIISNKIRASAKFLTLHLGLVLLSFTELVQF